VYAQEWGSFEFYIITDLKVIFFFFARFIIFSLWFTAIPFPETARWIHFARKRREN